MSMISFSNPYYTLQTHVCFGYMFPHIGVKPKAGNTHRTVYPYVLILAKFPLSFLIRSPVFADETTILDALRNLLFLADHLFILFILLFPLSSHQKTASPVTIYVAITEPTHPQRQSRNALDFNHPRMANRWVYLIILVFSPIDRRLFVYLSHFLGGSLYLDTHLGEFLNES